MSTERADVAARLAAVRHYECGDSWYSCPESSEGCSNDAEGDEPQQQHNLLFFHGEFLERNEGEGAQTRKAARKRDRSKEWGSRAIF